MDPTSYDPVKLYIHAFGMGMTDAIAEAFDEKAERVAQVMPVAYEVIHPHSVVAAEARGVRQLAADLCPTLPVRDRRGSGSPCSGSS